MISRLGAAALALATAMTMALAATPGAAETIEVKMLNEGPDGQYMVFEPAVVSIEPGDTVHFKSVDQGHNAQSLQGMIPDGAESFRGAMNADFKVTFEVEGTYAYKCLPHLYSGMVGVVKVGDASSNLQAVRNQVSGLPKQARDRLKAMLASGGS
jgi:pseudoazurin